MSQQKQKVRWLPPSGKGTGAFDYDQERLHVQLAPYQQMLVFIPFDGDEKVCWTCGGDRCIAVRLDLDGDLIDFIECCDKPPKFLEPT